MNVELVEYKILNSSPFKALPTKREIVQYMEHENLSFKRELVLMKDSDTDYCVHFYLSSSHKIFVQNSNLMEFKVPFIDKYGFLSEVEIDNAVNGGKYIEMLSVTGFFIRGEVKPVTLTDVILILQRYVEFKGKTFEVDMSDHEFTQTLELTI